MANAQHMKLNSYCRKQIIQKKCDKLLKLIDKHKKKGDWNKLGKSLKQYVELKEYETLKNYGVECNQFLRKVHSLLKNAEPMVSPSDDRKEDPKMYKKRFLTPKNDQQQQEQNKQDEFKKSMESIKADSSLFCREVCGDGSYPEFCRECKNRKPNQTKSNAIVPEYQIDNYSEQDERFNKDYRPSTLQQLQDIQVLLMATLLLTLKLREEEKRLEPLKKEDRDRDPNRYKKRDKELEYPDGKYGRIGEYPWDIQEEPKPSDGYTGSRGRRHYKDPLQQDQKYSPGRHPSPLTYTGPSARHGYAVPKQQNQGYDEYDKENAYPWGLDEDPRYDKFAQTGHSLFFPTETKRKMSPDTRYPYQRFDRSRKSPVLKKQDPFLPTIRERFTAPKRKSPYVPDDEDRLDKINSFIRQMYRMKSLLNTVPVENKDGPYEYYLVRRKPEKDTEISKQNSIQKDSSQRNSVQKETQTDISGDILSSLKASKISKEQLSSELRQRSPKSFSREFVIAPPPSSMKPSSQLSPQSTQSLQQASFSKEPMTSPQISKVTPTPQSSLQTSSQLPPQQPSDEQELLKPEPLAYSKTSKSSSQFSPKSTPKPSSSSLLSQLRTSQKSLQDEYKKSEKSSEMGNQKSKFSKEIRSDLEQDKMPKDNDNDLGEDNGGDADDENGEIGGVGEEKQRRRRNTLRVREPNM